MVHRYSRIALLLSFTGTLLIAASASAASPAPCQILTAEAWSSVMGYKATATPGDMNCTYEGAGKTGAGQFRIMAVAASTAEAEASAKRMQNHPHRGSHDAGLTAFDSQGTVVFSISLFQHAANDSSAAQLQKLVAAAKQKLAK